MHLCLEDPDFGDAGVFQLQVGHQISGLWHFCTHARTCRTKTITSLNASTLDFVVHNSYGELYVSVYLAIVQLQTLSPWSCTACPEVERPVFVEVLVLQKRPFSCAMAVAADAILGLSTVPIHQATILPCSTHYEGRSCERISLWMWFL